MDRQINYNASSSPYSPESGYYASSPDSFMAMSPVQSMSNIISPIRDNCMSPTQNIKLRWCTEPQSMFRFRYESEMNGTHGSLMGTDSARDSKTFPSIKLDVPPTLIAQYPVVRVRCTLHQAERRGGEVLLPHSHQLVIKTGDREKFDPHFVDAKAENNYKVEFKGMGIIHTAKKDIVKGLGNKMVRLKEFELGRELSNVEQEMERRKIRETEAKVMNLNQVSLCFEAFVFDQFENMWKKICPAIFSKPINNIKSALVGELKICSYSTCTSCVTGGQEVYLLVEKVNRGDIKVRFFDESGWEADARIENVHHQFAIVLTTPPYHNQNIEKPVNVFMQLYRTKDKCISEARSFTYKPTEYLYSRKRRMISHERETPPLIPTNLDRASPMQTSPILIPMMAGLNLCMLDIPLSPDEEEKVNNLAIQLQREFEQKNMMNVPNLDCNLEFDSVSESEVTNWRLDAMAYELHKLLSISIERGMSSVFKTLLKGLKKHKITDYLNAYNEYGKTCLHLACAYGRESFVQQLLESGADPNIVDNLGNTPLHVCVIKQQEKCLATVLSITKDSLNLEIKNYEGFAPLHLAVKYGLYEIFIILWEANTNIFTTHAQTLNTILHTAIEQGSLNLIKFIIKNSDGELINMTNSNNETPLEVFNAAKETLSHELSAEIERCLRQNGAKMFEEILDSVTAGLESLNLPSECGKQQVDKFKIPQETLDILKKHREEISGQQFEIDAIPSALSGLNASEKNTIDFDELATAELCPILNKNKRWEQLAQLLNYGNFIDIWGVTANPAECLLDYIKGSKDLETTEFIDLLKLLDMSDAVSVIDGMIARHM